MVNYVINLYVDLILIILFYSLYYVLMMLFIHEYSRVTDHQPANSVHIFNLYKCVCGYFPFQHVTYTRNNILNRFLYIFFGVVMRVMYFTDVFFVIWLVYCP